MNASRVASFANEIARIAVAICRTSHGNYHTGVAYKHSDGDIHLFHQAFHHQTRDQPIALESARTGGPFLCVVPDVEEDRAKAIAGLWEFWTSRNENIDYALRDDPYALFDPATGLLAFRDGLGLSCSTFVLTLFRSARFPYLDTTDWPKNRPGDREAQESLVRWLEEQIPGDPHVERVRKEIGCERVRPEEVAGTAMFDNLPVKHPEAERGGAVLMEELEKRRHSQPIGML